MKGRNKTIASIVLIIGVLIIPLIYSGLYLASVWDAYGRMDALPVAVVNEDKGAVIDGEEQNLGQQLVDTLAENKTLDWAFVDKEQAEEGLEVGNVYYAVIQIPEDFSKDIASASTENKSPATITYSSNEKRNYIASTILKSAMMTVKDSLKSSVSEQISDNLIQQLERVPNEMETLDDGLKQLQDGSNQLQDGMTQLADGNNTLTENLGTLTNGLQQAESGANQIQDGLTKVPELIDGAQQLQDGANAVNEGAQQLQSGVNSVNDGAQQLQGGAQQLQGGMGQVSDGASTLNAGISQLQGGINQAAAGAGNLETGAAQLDQGLQNYVAQVNQILAASGNTAVAQQVAAAGEQLLSGSQQVSAGASSLNSAMGQLSAGAQQVSTGSASLQDGISQVSAGADQLVDGINSLSAGTGALAEGSATLTAGTNSLAAGSSTLSAGAGQLTALQSGVGQLSDALGQLSSGAQQLYDGSQTLGNGIQSASDGAKTLGDGITTAEKAVSKSIKTAQKELRKTNGLSEFAGTSVDVEADPYDSVPNYGSGFAPYFMNVSLWAGGLTLMMSIYLDYKRRMKLLSPESDRPWLRLLSLMGIGAGQALLVGIIGQFALGLQINNVAMYYGGLILAAITYTSIILFLMDHLGDVGKLLSMVLLVFQLTATGGSFPVEMTPGFFQFLNPLLPMTYSIRFQKEAISGTNYGYMWLNLAVLAGFFVVFAAGTLGLDYLKKHLKKKKGEDFTEHTELLNDSI